MNDLRYTHSVCNVSCVRSTQQIMRGGSVRMNISVPDELAEQVRTLKIPISETCQRALRDAVESALLRETSDMQEITVEVGHPAVKVSFVGRWLLEPHPEATLAGLGGMYFGVALTKRGRIAVFGAHAAGVLDPFLKDYDSVDEAAKAGVPESIIAIARDALTTESSVVWRDI